MDQTQDTGYKRQYDHPMRFEAAPNTRQYLWPLAASAIFIDFCGVDDRQPHLGWSRGGVCNRSRSIFKATSGKQTFGA